MISKYKVRLELIVDADGVEDALNQASAKLSVARRHAGDNKPLTKDHDFVTVTKEK